MKIYVLAIGILIASSVNAQVVVFNQINYHVGESIKANASGGLRGIENDITNSSFTAGDGSVNIGRAQSPGFHRVNFKFLTGDKTYLITVLANAEVSPDNLNIEIDNSKKISVTAPLQLRIFNYFKQSSGDIILTASKTGLQNFCTKNAVSLVANAAFCITSVSGGIVVLPICKSLSQDNLKELGKEMTLAFFDDMKAKDFISQQELNDLKQLMEQIDFAGVLESNCSLLFKSMQKLSDNEDIKIAFGFFEQQCKTTVLIIEKFNKPL
jgi:hypothetical protein